MSLLKLCHVISLLRNFLNQSSSVRLVEPLETQACRSDLGLHLNSVMKTDIRY